MQDGKLFNDTIQNNIVLDDANIDYEALQKAVEVANISHEIEAMPQGYQTMIGGNGQGFEWRATGIDSKSALQRSGLSVSGRSYQCT